MAEAEWAEKEVQEGREPAFKEKAGPRGAPSEEQSFTLLSLAPLFGGNGCPGEWMVNACARKGYHAVGYEAGAS